MRLSSPPIIDNEQLDLHELVMSGRVVKYSEFGSKLGSESKLLERNVNKKAIERLLAPSSFPVSWTTIYIYNYIDQSWMSHNWTNRTKSRRRR